MGMPAQIAGGCKPCGAPLAAFKPWLLQLCAEALSWRNAAANFALCKLLFSFMLL